MTKDHGPTNTEGQPGLGRAALSGLCPRCNAPTLFEAPARLAMKCSQCGLQFSELERGGRFVGIATMLLALVMIVTALAIEEYFRPPLLLQLVFWAPVTVGGVIGFLRLYKTTLLYAAYERQQDKRP
jgi:uncharacterized protein (DUF983 family)